MCLAGCGGPVWPKCQGRISVPVRPCTKVGNLCANLKSAVWAFIFPNGYKGTESSQTPSGW